MPPVYVHHLFWHAPLAFCAFHTYGRKNNDDTDDSVYTGIEYNRNHDAKHKIVLLWIFKNEFVKHPEFLMQGLFFRHASVSSTYPVSPSIRLYVTFFLRISILSASLRPHKASRLHFGDRHGGWHGSRHGGAHGSWHGGGQGGWYGGWHGGRYGSRHGSRKKNQVDVCMKTKLMYNKVYWVEAVCRGVYPDQRHNDNNSLQM